MSSRIVRLHCALAGLAATLAGLSVAGCGAADPQPVSVFPVPGGRVAAPQTQITLRGVTRGHLGRVIVTGSQTHRHTGRVLFDSDGDGASFLPAKPFAVGEKVTVTTKLDIRGARAGTFHFTVAHPAGAIPAMPLDLADRVPGDELTFRSRPDLTPPAVEVTRQTADAAPGDIFITPQQGPTQNGAMILNGDGALIWFQPVKPPDTAADLRVQKYQGKPVLTWWQGYSGAGVGAGEDIIYDSSYRQVAVVKAGNGLTADLHEFRITPEGTALITAYYPVLWDASALHGAKQQVVLDSVVQEIDIKTGLVLYQWDSLDHVPLADTYETMPKSSQGPFDYFHVNSVQEQPNGDLLIGARNTWAAYDINHQTGAVVWTLGGRNSSYKLSSGAVFAFQHDVRLHTETDPTVTLFDDGGGPPRVHAESRGDHGSAQQQRQDRDPGQPGAAFAGAGRRVRGERRGAVERRPVRGVGPAALLQRIQHARPAGVRRALRGLELELPRLSARVDRQAGRTPGGQRHQRRHDRERVRELERRHPGGVVAGPSRRGREHAPGRGDRDQAGVREPDRDRRRAIHRGPGARRSRARAGHVKRRPRLVAAHPARPPAGRLPLPCGCSRSGAPIT